MAVRAFDDAILSVPRFLVPFPFSHRGRLDVSTDVVWLAPQRDHHRCVYGPRNMTMSSNAKLSVPHSSRRGQAPLTTFLFFRYISVFADLS